MQAARGTSLSDAVESPPVPAPGHRLRLRAVFAGIATLGLALDQVTKALALEHLASRDVSLVGSWFTLHLTKNPGAAFSTGTEYTLVLSLLAITAVAVVLYLSRRLGSRAWAASLGLLLAGVSGNLADRLFREPAPLRGHVIDFLMLPNWPVFNIADICINVAAGLILLQAFRGVRIDGTRDSARGRTSDSAQERGTDSAQEREA
jgi:signal peptidase II